MQELAACKEKGGKPCWVDKEFRMMPNSIRYNTVLGLAANSRKTKAAAQAAWR